MDNQIGPFLRTARLSAGMTQEAAGKLAGISRQQINRIENGYGTEWDTVDKLTDVYGCSKADAVRIFTGTVEAKPEVRLANRLGQILALADPSEREQIGDTLAEVAERMVNMLRQTRNTAGAGASTSIGGKRTHNSVLYASFDRTTRLLPASLPGFPAIVAAYVIPARFPIPAV